MSDYASVISALEYIDPAECEYNDWLMVGQALHHDGYPLSVWDDWSARDAKRYSGDVCEKKWLGFGNQNGKPVTCASIIAMAQEQGWQDKGRALSWGDFIGGGITSEEWADDMPIEHIGNDAADELKLYLQTLFDDADIIGYATTATKDGEKWKPADKGIYTRTAGDIIAALESSGDVGKALSSTLNKDAGAWIRFNPLDGNGVGNQNVTAYRFALVESDSIDESRQRGIIDALKLPCAAIVSSGNKSLHAIVRIDANDMDEYRHRVEKLFEVCDENGLKVDRQNKNPSRLSRMPGIDRGSRHQSLIAVNVGLPSWAEWEDWYDEQTDDLPDMVPLDKALATMKPLAPALIEGILREGHKCLIAGPSKSGKSFSLMELALCVANGRDWMGTWHCERGRVVYLNLEVDENSCIHRFSDISDAMALTVPTKDVIIWPLRGKGRELKGLVPSLVRRLRDMDVAMVIIDPIYKVMTGDENSAGDMAAMTNQFDRISELCRTAVVYCHHHSKGAQGAKRSIDRASGSGVFARDPDAFLDFSLLEPDEGTRQAFSQLVSREHRIICMQKAGIWADGDEGKMTEELERLTRERLQFGSPDVYPEAYNAIIYKVEEAKTKALQAQALRIEATLREFASPPPVDVWFRHPLHVPDSAGLLQSLSVDNGNMALNKARKMANEKHYSAINDEMARAWNRLTNSGKRTTTRAMAEELGWFDGEDKPDAKHVRNTVRNNWCNFRMVSNDDDIVVVVPLNDR